MIRAFPRGVRDLPRERVEYGSLTAFADGTVDASRVRGVDPDLRVRPFFHHGGTISIREFVMGAFKDEMGLEASDPLLLPAGDAFVVEKMFSDFRRHDLGPAFHERNYDGTRRTEFMTEALWGVGSSGPYGHDGRSMNLEEVILRHGGEAQRSRDAFARLREDDQRRIFEFLQTLVLFPPDDTASNLNPGNRGSDPQEPVNHGSINLGALFQIPEEGPE